MKVMDFKLKIEERINWVARKKSLKITDCHLFQKESKVLKLLLMRSLHLRLYCNLKFANLKIEYVTKIKKTKV
jgi:hypothetical protein